jgi:dipeptidyl aminopeptidase/acylaminoacyl peptidase
LTPASDGPHLERAPARPRWCLCGTDVSFAWAPDGKRVAFSLDEIAGDSPYVGLHIVNVVSGRDTEVPQGAPQTATMGRPRRAWQAYFQKTQDRIGCGTAVELAWSPDGSRLAYRCGPDNSGRTTLNVLSLKGSGHTTIPTGSNAYWPSWSPTGNRIV